MIINKFFWQPVQSMRSIWLIRSHQDPVALQLFIPMQVLLAIKPHSRRHFTNNCDGDCEAWNPGLSYIILCHILWLMGVGAWNKYNKASLEEWQRSLFRFWKNLTKKSDLLRCQFSSCCQRQGQCQDIAIENERDIILSPGRLEKM